MNQSSLIVTGNKLGGGYRVVFNGRVHQVNAVPVLVLLHLILAQIEHHDGWLSLTGLCTAWGNCELGRRQIQRLREALEDNNKKLVINDQKGNYALSIPFHQITLDSTVWSIDPPEADINFIKRLESAYHRHRPRIIQNNADDLYFRFLVVTTASFPTLETSTIVHCVDQVSPPLIALTPIISSLVVSAIA